ncbi:MAG: hypothetical protein F6J90_25840 [Moorea sp. SIOASIH]|uniref:hypothetical protein n=1 Tax=Moorena sp. SIOASIH TaxID=2607817 RepID=UPI0013BC0C57|nr:hypothetical protein [Moorena sp. SIOASIH]NEO39568.1 hypothetical protein [Moorena sp. SIOASIH]
MPFFLRFVTWGMGSGESGVGNRESGIGNRESIGNREINRRVGSGCCLKLASSREAHYQPLPTRQELIIVGWAVAIIARLGNQA